MQRSTFAGFGDSHVGTPWDQREALSYCRDVLVVPPSVYDDAAKLGFVSREPVSSSAEADARYFASLVGPAVPSFWSNIFAPPLARKSFQANARRMMPLGMLLHSLREEAVLLSVAALRRICRRVHPRSAILASLTSTSCQLKDIVESLQRSRRVVDKWLQRLRKEGTVGYRRDVSWFLRSDAMEQRQ